MANEIEIKVNRDAEKKLDEAIRNGLKKIGMMAESYAKMLSPADTGLLRNSITFAIGGEMPKIIEYRDDNGENQHTYDSTAPADEDGKTTLYIGTNVHYAPYQELGHMTVKGDWIDPQPFLRPAIENHASEYEQIMKDELRKL